MKSKFVKLTSLVLCMIVLLNFTITSYANSKSNENNDFSNITFTDLVGEVLIDDQLANITKNNNNVIEIEGEKDGVISKVKINKQTGKITAKTIDKDKNEANYNVIVKIENKEEGKYTSIYENIDSKEKFEIKSKDNDKVHGSAWVLIPVGVGLVDIYVGGVLVGTCVALTVAVAGKVYDLITDKAQTKIKSSTRDYYPAVQKGNWVYYNSIKPMTLSEASAWVLAGNSVMSKNKTAALTLTSALGGYVRYENHKIGAPGYFWHYHPKVRTTAHIWHLGN